MNARESKSNRIQRAPLSAPATAIGHPSIGLAALLFAALLALTLALAPRAEAFVYWTNFGGGTIGRANPDGSGLDQEFITTGLATGSYEFHFLSEVAVNGGHVYWSHFGSRTGGGTGGGTTIGRANLDGSGADRAFITGASSPAGLALDANHIYWTNFSGGTIGRAKLDGTNVDQSFITAADGPGGIAVNGEHVYWTNFGSPTGGGTTIGRANLDGTNADQSFITGASSPAGLRVNDTHVYWVNGPTDTIGRANLDGTGVNQGFITAPNNGRALAIDPAHIYWANFSVGADLVGTGTIARANLDGTGTEPDFIRFEDADAWGVDVDALRSFSFGKVKRDKKRGTAKLTIVVPGAGNLRLAKSKDVRGQEKRAEAEGRAKLAVRPKGKAKRRLTRKGQAKVDAEVTYTPIGGDPTIVANTLAEVVRLVRRG